MKDKRTQEKTSSKKDYQQPELTVWGSVAELTAAGCTNPGGDSMGGSIEHASGPPEDTPAECQFG